MAVRIQLRRDTSTNWSQNNPVLRPGEIGIETDTLKFKIGPAVLSPAIGTAWNSISTYANVVPSDLNNTLNNYLQTSDLGDTVAELVDGNLYIPGLDVIFEGTNADAHEITLRAPEATADRTITLPDVNGTVVTTGDTGSVTNAMLAGSIANNKLANSSITINGFPISLGGEATYSTDNIQEGGTNKYFSVDAAQDATAQALANGTHTNITVVYNDNDNSISLSAAPGYTNEEARDAVAGLITGSTHDGVSVSYTDDGGNAGSLAFTNTDKGSSQSIFKNIVVGETTVVADSNNDTLTIVGSNGVGALANATNDVIEIYNTGVTSVSGTSNEIEVSGSTGSVTIGLPNDVTISGNLTLSNAPTQALHAATKAYVDNTTAGLNFHAPVHAATTANLDATYNNGTSGVGATLTANANGALILDGHTLNADERVLVKNQITAFQNGVYVVSVTGDGSNPWVLTRATDSDNSPAGEMAYGDFVFVQNGGQAGYGFIVNTTGTITIGTTGISYVQFNAGQVVVAGNGLTESSPGTLAINTAVTVDVSTAQTLTNKTITGTFTGNLTGNADTATNGVVTTGSYTDPSWLTITKTKVGLSNVENTALSTWAGSTNITTLGTVGTGTWNATTIATTRGGTGLTSYATGDIPYASDTNTLSKLALGTEGYLLTATTNGPVWAAAPISLPSQTGESGKYLTTDGTTASWATVDALPSQTGESGKYLTTDGTVASWAAIEGFNFIPAVQATTVRDTLNNPYGVIMQDPETIDLTTQDLSLDGMVVLPYDLNDGDRILFRHADLDDESWAGIYVYDATVGSLTKTNDVITEKSVVLVDTSYGYYAGAYLLGSTINTKFEWYPLTLPAQWSGGNPIKFLANDGTNTFWQDVPTPVVTGTATLTGNTAAAVDSFSLVGQSIEYTVSLSQGSKRRTSKVIVSCTGSAVDMTEFAIIEMGGIMSGIQITATASASSGNLEIVVTDAASTNVDVKFTKIEI